MTAGPETDDYLHPRADLILAAIAYEQWLTRLESRLRDAVAKHVGEDRVRQALEEAAR